MSCPEMRNPRRHFRRMLHFTNSLHREQVGLNRTLGQLFTIIL